MKVNLKNPNEFRKMLIKKGYSQRKLAKAIDLSSPYVNQIVNGERFPSGEVANRIAEHLDLEFDDIFFINDTSKS
jgi:DNA-binding XRE family transcriptional regulator